MSNRLIVVGTSKGGLSALEKMLASFSDGFSWPIVIAQHRSKEDDANLCEFMGKACELPLTEPEDKEPIEGGKVYLAPADYHLLIDNDHFALSTGSPSVSARPSINYLFESAAESFESNTIGIILTGTSSDGAVGLAAIKRHGGRTIVQDPDTADSSLMPRAAMGQTEVDHVLSIEQIGPFLNSLWQESCK